MKFTLNIPKPCSENWNEMTPTEKGKFCAVCEKDLVDFRALSNQSIYDIVAADKKVCGRFSVDQLNTEFYAKKENHFSRLGLVVGFTSLVSFVQPVGAQIPNNTIVQSSETSDILDELTTTKDTVTIKGKITDDGEPLPFVKLIVKNKDTVFAATDIEGDFVLKIPSYFFEDTVFVEVSYLGYENNTILISEKDQILNVDLTHMNYVLLEL